MRVYLYVKKIKGCWVFLEYADAPTYRVLPYIPTYTNIGLIECIPTYTNIELIECLQGKTDVLIYPHVLMYFYIPTSTNVRLIYIPTG
jgi:hypothetical protein